MAIVKYAASVVVPVSQGVEPNFTSWSLVLNKNLGATSTGNPALKLFVDNNGNVVAFDALGYQFATDAAGNFTVPFFKIFNAPAYVIQTMDQSKLTGKYQVFNAWQNNEVLVLKGSATLQTIDLTSLGVGDDFDGAGVAMSPNGQYIAILTFIGFGSVSVLLLYKGS